jgi:hypothetical protein
VVGKERVEVELAPPRLYGSDRGFFSEKNLAACARSGVEVVCIPQRGGKKQLSAKTTRRAASSRKVSASAPASRGAYQYCFAAAE